MSDNNIMAPTNGVNTSTAPDADSRVGKLAQPFKLTLLRCAPNLLLAKQYPGANGEWLDYDRAAHFDAAEIEVYGHRHLAEWLIELSHQPNMCVVRGALAGDDRKYIRRKLLHNGGSLIDVPRLWLALDLDSLPLPDGIDPRDLLACARAVAPMLPPAFQHARCVVQATAGHGIKPGARLRLWYWLDSPITCADAKQWLKQTNAPVDLSLCGAAQVTYTAAPLFLDGRLDPLPARVVIRDGVELVEVPDPAELAPPESPPPRPGNLDCGMTRNRLSGIIRNVLDAPKGQRNSRLHWSAARLGEAHSRGEIKLSIALNVLLEAARRVGLTQEEAEATVSSGFNRGKAEAGTAREFRAETRQ